VRCVMLANNYIYYGIHGHGVQHITICRTLTEIPENDNTVPPATGGSGGSSQVLIYQTVPAAVPSHKQFAPQPRTPAASASSGRSQLFHVGFRPASHAHLKAHTPQFRTHPLNDRVARFTRATKSADHALMFASSQKLSRSAETVKLGKRGLRVVPIAQCAKKTRPDPVYLDIGARRPRADTRPSYRNCQARQEVEERADCSAPRLSPVPCHCSAPRVQARQESINRFLSDAAEVRQPLPLCQQGSERHRTSCACLQGLPLYAEGTRVLQIVNDYS
jgi:hypothetical protein